MREITMQQVHIKEVFAYSEIVGGSFWSQISKDTLDIVFVRHFHNKLGGERYELVYAEGGGKTLLQEHPAWQEVCAYLTIQSIKQNNSQQR
jgi:hypothetical protein